MEDMTTNTTLNNDITDDTFVNFNGEVMTFRAFCDPGFPGMDEWNRFLVLQKLMAYGQCDLYDGGVITLAN